MPICLWKGCEFISEDMAAFQEHVNTKHALQQELPQQQEQQLNLDKQNGVGIQEEQDLADQMIEENKMINRGGQRKIIFLAIEVWVDVLGFVKRIQLARGVCFANFKIYEICWPRLHGDKVVAHRAQHITIGYDDESGHPPRAILLKDYNKVGFPECPLPAYITGFGCIVINFLNDQVFTFLSFIAPRITTNRAKISIGMELSNLDENQLASVNGLLQLFREKITTIRSIHFYDCLSNIPYLPDFDNGMNVIDCWRLVESDIPILMPFLASPRPDGQQRVMSMYLGSRDLPSVQKLLDAIIEDFRTSTQPMPQPFFLQIRANLNIPQSEEENQQTDETLTIMPRGNRCLEICRYPRGQHEKWAEDGRKRLIELPLDNLNTIIRVEISEFGLYNALLLSCWTLNMKELWI